MTRFFIKLAGLTAMAVASQGAAARDFESTIPTLPLHYRYAACVFAADAPNADLQIASCAPLRTHLEAVAETVIAEFHNSAIEQERRQFLQSLDLLEVEARELREERKDVPPVLLAYLDCVAGEVMDSAGYRSGIAVDFSTAYRPCSEGAEIKADARGDRTINALQHRFELRRRYVDPKAPGSRWSRLEWDYGFFDRRRLPDTGTGEAT